jgi:hypothetical protein
MSWLRTLFLLSSSAMTMMGPMMPPWCLSFPHAVPRRRRRSSGPASPRSSPSSIIRDVAAADDDPGGRGDYSPPSSSPRAMIGRLSSGGGGRRRWRRRRREEGPSVVVVEDDGDDGDDADDDDGGEDEDARGMADRLPAGEDDDAEANDDAGGDFAATGARPSSPPPPTATEPPRCAMPSFSRTFPRYRVDHPRSSSHGGDDSDRRRARRLRRGTITKLARPRRPGDGNDGGGGAKSPGRAGGGRNGGDPLGILDGILGVFSDPTGGGNNAARARRAVESLYRGEMERGDFRWVSVSSSSSDPSRGGAADGDDDAARVPSRTVDEDFHAAAEFWRMAADIVAGLAADPPPPLRDAAALRRRDRRSWYLAMPETTPAVARCLCDNLNWYADHYSSGTNIAEEGWGEGGEADLIIRSDLDARFEGGRIPVVKFTATIDDGARRRLRRRIERRGLLPRPEDTERRAKAWVKRMLVQLGICPFTKSEIRSGQGLKDLGVPVAGIMYRHSEALGVGSDVYLLMAGKFMRRWACFSLSLSFE